jgi:HK97 family phage portal protein
MLPWRVFLSEGRKRVLQDKTTLDRILHKSPNPEQTSFTFREYLVGCALLWGNGYAEIERNMMGEVIALWPIHPSRVELVRINGRLAYKVSSSDGGSEPVYIPAWQMFHIKGPTMDGLQGHSMISLARESFGLGIAAQTFGASYFGNGGVPAVVIRETAESTTEMTKEAIANLLASFDRRHSGASKAGRSAYLEKGYEIEPIGIPQKDAQFIETRKHQVTEIARWFRLPPHKIGDMEKTNFSNIEQQNIDFVTDSIMPWVSRLEQEADQKLHDSPGILTKIAINGLLRGDSQARSEMYNKMWNIGTYSINDIRRLEDLDPIDGGDEHFVPLNMIALSKAVKDGGTGRDTSMRGVLVDAHQRMLTKEIRAVERAHGSQDNFIGWCAEFYSRHRAQLSEALLPGARALGDSWDLSDQTIVTAVQAHCERYVEESLNTQVDDVESGQLSEKWLNRAETAADLLIARLAGAKQ